MGWLLRRPAEQLGYRENGLESLAHNPARPHQKEFDSDELVVIPKSHAAPEQRHDSESILLKLLEDMHINITSSNSTKEHLFQPTRPVEVVSPSNQNGSPHLHEPSDNMDDDLESYFEFLERQREDIKRQGFEKRDEQVQEEELPLYNEWPTKDSVYNPDLSEPDFEDAGCPPGMTCGGLNMKRPAPDLGEDADARCTGMFCSWIERFFLGKKQVLDEKTH